VATRRMPFDDLTRLATAHAALDPEREEWRSDILISSLIEILTVKGVRGALEERRLLSYAKELWHTEVVDKRLLRRALERAEKGNLIERRRRSHETLWVASPASMNDARADHEWARSIIRRFGNGLGTRLPDLLEDHRRRQCRHSREGEVA
jgi:hypothetical protein